MNSISVSLKLEMGNENQSNSVGDVNRNCDQQSQQKSNNITVVERYSSRSNSLCSSESVDSRTSRSSKSLTSNSSSSSSKTGVIPPTNNSNDELLSSSSSSNDSLNNDSANNRIRKPVQSNQRLKVAGQRPRLN